MKMSLKCTMASEHQEQAAFMSWLERFYPNVYEMTYHVPNGRKSAAEGSKYKALGAKSGVPDLCIAYPIYPYHGLYFEFKRRNGGVVSETQKEWLAKLSSHGYKACVVAGWEEATRQLKTYLETKL